MYKFHSRFLLATSVLTSITTASYAAPVLLSDDDVGLEEIVVTAQKRAQNYQDVPISLSALSGGKLQESGINDLEAMSKQIPNFSVNKAGIGDEITMRGIRSSSMPALEQSVATFVDNVYRGRGVQSRFAFLDVQAVEILRGPQGTLFGKNTIGGAINIKTGKPTSAWEGEVDASYEYELQGKEIGGYVSGPVTDTLSIRAAAVYRSNNKGWVENSYFGNSGLINEEFAGRFSFDYAMSDSTKIYGRVEHGQWQDENFPISQLVAGKLAAFGIPDGDFENSIIGSGAPFADIGATGVMDGDFTEISATFEHYFKSDAMIEIILSRSEYDYMRDQDVDFSLLSNISYLDAESFSQDTVEFIYKTPTFGDVEYIIGGFYQTSDLNADADAGFNVQNLQGLAAAGCSLNGSGGPGAASLFSADPTVAIGALMATTSSADLNTCFSSAATASMPNFNRYINFDQGGDALGLYAQATWSPTDELRVTGGIRYTREKKEAIQTLVANAFGTRTLDPNAIGALAAVGESVQHVFSATRIENKVTWSMNALYYMTDDIMGYFSAGTGHKAGGFNAFAATDDVNENEYNPEGVTNFELGMKLRTADRAFEINAGLFYTLYDDLQISQFTGATSFVVQNAAKAEIKGLELDGRWQASQALMIKGSASYIDFKYTEFPGAGCTNDQLNSQRQSIYDAAKGDLETALAASDMASAATAAGGMTAGALFNMQQCTGARINDLKGRTASQTPKIVSANTFDHESLWGDYVLNSIVTFKYKSAAYRAADLDENMLQTGYTKVDAALKLTNEDINWEFSLIGRNIFDKKTYSYAQDTPLLPGTYHMLVDRPRTIQLKAKYCF